MDVDFLADIIGRVEALINQQTVSVPAYPEAAQSGIDTEESA